MDGDQDTKILVIPSWTAVTFVGGEVPTRNHYLYSLTMIVRGIPGTVMLAESEEGLLLATLHV